MTPELWRAKKIVDSTLHPGTHDDLFPLSHKLINHRHRPTRLPPLPNVLLRHLQPRGHSRHAHPGPPNNRHSPLANNQPIPQRRHQQRQRQQINLPLHLHPHPIILPRRLRILLRRPRPQLACPAPEAPFTRHKNDLDTARALCSRGLSWRSQRLPHARRRDQKRHRRLPISQRSPEVRPGEARER